MDYPEHYAVRLQELFQCISRFSHARAWRWDASYGTNETTFPRVPTGIPVSTALKFGKIILSLDRSDTLLLNVVSFKCWITCLWPWPKGYQGHWSASHVVLFCSSSVGIIGNASTIFCPISGHSPSSPSSSLRTYPPGPQLCPLTTHAHRRTVAVTCRNGSLMKTLERMLLSHPSCTVT